MIGLLNANALSIPMADKSVQMVATSPPYYGLRDYQVKDQLGLEPTPEEYVSNLVTVFRELWRVLRDDGVVFLNLGDSYNNTSGFSRCQDLFKRDGRNGGSATKTKFNHDEIKTKDLIGIPWMTAFALRKDGWYLRSDIIWHKPNPMPEPVTDRPTSAHEHIFLLSKQAKYYYDAEAIREPNSEKYTASFGNFKRNKIVGKMADIEMNKSDYDDKYRTGGRNCRNVWHIATAPYKGAHFATWPPKLVEPMIKAGSRPGDTVLDPFAGSGTTLMVARQLGRSAIGLDLSFAYLKENATKRLELDKLKAWVGA